MFLFADAIDARAVGQYPLSVATSLAVEAACGEHPDHPADRAPILDYEELWVNLRTLFRNFLGALDRNTAGALEAPTIAASLAVEMETIRSIIADHSENRTAVIFYYSNYADLERKYRHAVVRVDSTEKQKEYTHIHNETMDLMLRQHQGDVLGFDLKLKPERKTDALVLTHYAYDLLAWPLFKHLALLESHTGAIKERAQWYTKFYQGKELPMIPFREDMLQVFGDNETFRPMDIRLRRELIDIATKYKWTSVTTREKIIYGIDQMKNPMARTLLKEILV